ncbi:MAG: hypothetical protein CL477_19375 [Acidobacteria bacterium]|jgi:hypothetical protein|nr:hypothetical protein [Acidobacteriota bacterium]HJN45935.1 hypothetical protein [Vicinamibacterales bacterium]
MRILQLLCAATLLCLLSASPALAQASDMTFFLTSVGSGSGADLGALAGADAHCQSLAAAVGGGNKTWRAYLSTTGSGGVNARDRIGSGPWQNVAGVVVARDLDQLHYENNLTKETVLNEKGEMTNGRGDDPNQHDILTGSNLDGTASSDTDACSNWTSSADGGTGSAMVGHFDRTGGGANPNSWNSAHGSRGCSQANLIATGGNGYFYCFAAN